MNRFVKNNLVLIIVLGISLVATIGLLVWTTMQYLQMWQYITQTENLREILQRNGFSFKKQFGQNFISDANLLSSIVSAAGIGGEDTVLEIE